MSRATAALLVLVAAEGAHASLLLGGAAPRSTRRTAGVRAAADISELSLTPSLAKTVKGFQMVPDQKLRYQQLLFFAKKLDPMDPALQVDANKVPGCLSTVYVHATCEGDCIIYTGESDSQLTKGLAALLIQGLSGCTNEQIQAVKPEFIQAAGLAQSLTPGRNNGFVNMLAKMKQQAAALSDGGAGEGTAAASGVRAGQAQMSFVGEVSLGPAGQRMVAALEAALSPSELQLLDDSASHAGHAGSKGFESGESHFDLRIRSAAFEGVRSLRRHQLVYAALEQEMPQIHALSIKALAPEE